MADLELRRLERSAQLGDPQAAAREILMRVRAGQFPYDHVVWAAHLGDTTARNLIEEPRVVVDCPNCQQRRDERRRRNRDPRAGPTPVRETPRQCLRCRGSEKAVLEKGLINFVRQVSGVPHRLLIAWAADCVEHQLNALCPKPIPFGRYLLPNQPERDPELPDFVLPSVRRWLCNGDIEPLLYQRATTTGSVYTEFGVATALAIAVVLSEMEDEARMVRFRIAEIASTTYHAAKGMREERTWQEGRLIQYLLGYRE